MVRRHSILCLCWLAFGLPLTNVAAQGQGLKVECDQIGSSLDVFLASKAVDGQKQPIALPAQLHSSSLDSLRQYDSAHNLKNLEPTLTGDEIVTCFGNVTKAESFISYETQYRIKETDYVSKRRGINYIFNGAK